MGERGRGNRGEDSKIFTSKRALLSRAREGGEGFPCIIFFLFGEEAYMDGCIFHKKNTSSDD
jgi:hypothetical protein